MDWAIWKNRWIGLLKFSSECGPSVKNKQTHKQTNKQTNIVLINGDCYKAENQFIALYSNLQYTIVNFDSPFLKLV